MVRQNKKLIPVPKPPVDNYDKIIYIGVISILALVAFVGLSYLSVNSVGKAVQDEVDDNNIIDVKIQNFAFHPTIIKIKPGQTVRWTNYNVISHGIIVPTRFNKSYLGRDQSYSHTFDVEGIYDYHCSYHPNSMKGKIVVEETFGVFDYGLDEENLVEDYDNDGLPDSWEKSFTSSNCKLYYWLADSDGNELNDQEEDFDNDGKSNLEEYQGGTNPCDVEEVEEEELEEVEDCGKITVNYGQLNDLSCFITAAESCSKAKMEVESSLFFFGANINGATYYEIKGWENDKCMMNQETLSIDVKYSENVIESKLAEGMTLQEIEQQESEQDFGTTLTCKYLTEELTDIFEMWQEGGFSFSTSDHCVNECEGYLFDFSTGEVMDIISPLECGDSGSQIQMQVLNELNEKNEQLILSTSLIIVEPGEKKKIFVGLQNSGDTSKNIFLGFKVESQTGLGNFQSGKAKSFISKDSQGVAAEILWVNKPQEMNPTQGTVKTIILTAPDKVGEYLYKVVLNDADNPNVPIAMETFTVKTVEIGYLLDSEPQSDNYSQDPPVLDDDEPEPTSEPEILVKSHNISIEDNQLLLTNLTIFEDETVQWTNLDSTPHKIKSDDFKDSSLLYKNDTYQIKFSKDKVYNYICAVHPETVGQIIVLEGKEAETEEIEIQDNSFIPEEITIVVGDTIQWINKEEEDMPHSIISEDFNSSEDILLQDQTYSFTFDEAGEYTYNCGIHSDMQGNIKVLSAEEYGLKKKEDKLNKEQEDTDECVPNVVCGDWSFCSADLKQTKTCVDKNGCNNNTIFTQDCEECKESWICDGWELCLGGQEKRICHDEHSCGTFVSKPAESRSCEVPVVESNIVEDYYSAPPETTSARGFDDMDGEFKQKEVEEHLPKSTFSLSSFLDKFLISIIVVSTILILGIAGLVTFLVIKGNKLPSELISYVSRSKRNKINNIQIRKNLVKAGWKDKYIDKALK